MHLFEAANGVRWTHLRKLPETRAIKSMYLWLFIVPVAAKALSSVSSPANLKVFDYQIELHLELPFSWQAFYFAAVCFVLGSLAFSYSCPDIVKDHASYDSFSRKGKGFYHLNEYDLQVGRRAGDEGRFELRPYAGYMGESVEISNERQLRESFWSLHNQADRHNLLGRRVTGVSYAAGLFLLTWVVIENLLAVVRAML